MAPIEPENPESDDDAFAPPPPPARSNARPDWLVGADEGANAEMSRTRDKDRPHTPLRLVRPGEVAQPGEDDTDLDTPAGFERLPQMRAETTARPGLPVPKAKKPGPDVAAWQAAGSSIPKLRRSTPVVAAAPTSKREFTHEDEEVEVESDDQHPMQEIGTGKARAAAPPPLKPLDEAWYLVVFDALQTNRRLQILIAALLLVLGVTSLKPWQERPTPLSKIRKNSEIYDGHAVMVHGKVGDVFPIAGGYTYFLLQGRDTIVVFTHLRHPEMNQHLTVRGTVSTGYLDGLPRQAIFEDTK
jgi:hypothetical protein